LGKDRMIMRKIPVWIKAFIGLFMLIAIISAISLIGELPTHDILSRDNIQANMTLENIDDKEYVRSIRFNYNADKRDVKESFRIYVKGPDLRITYKNIKTDNGLKIELQTRGRKRIYSKELYNVDIKEDTLKGLKEGEFYVTFIFKKGMGAGEITFE